MTAFTSSELNKPTLSCQSGHRIAGRKADFVGGGTPRNRIGFSRVHMAGLAPHLKPRQTALGQIEDVTPCLVELPGYSSAECLRKNVWAHRACQTVPAHAQPCRPLWRCCLVRVQTDDELHSLVRVIDDMRMRKLAEHRHARGLHPRRSQYRRRSVPVCIVIVSGDTQRRCPVAPRCSSSKDQKSPVSALRLGESEEDGQPPDPSCASGSRWPRS